MSTWDVYVLTSERTLAVIERFVADYTTTDLAEARPYDLMVVPAGYDGESELVRDEHFEEVQVASMGEAVRYGLAVPGRAFWLYFSGKRPWFGAQMSFTLSNELTLGVSIDDPEDGWPGGPPVDGASLDASLNEARAVMAELAALPGARRTWIGANEPPTIDRRDEPWRWSHA